MSQKLINEALDSARSIGIKNILALRGDPPRNEEYLDMSWGKTNDSVENKRDFVWAVDLVKYIRERHGDYFCIGVAGYPEGHAEGTFPEVQDPLHDLPYLIEKTKAGADFIISQLFFDVGKYIDYEKSLRNDSSGVFQDIVIIPGLMPIQSYHILRRTTKLSHASLPPDILSRLDDVKGDDSKVKDVGVDILTEMIGKLKEAMPNCQARGFHFYTLNLEKAVSFVLERSNLIPPQKKTAFSEVAPNGVILNGVKRARRSSITSNPHNHLIVDGVEGCEDTSRLEPAGAAGYLQMSIGLEQHPEIALAIMEGEGTLGREATWDDFPNGRFGDARSPAFGDIDGYGPSLHMSHEQAIDLWGFPAEPADINDLFVKHVGGKLSAIPWSEEGLTEESQIIHDQLVMLNKKGWWTVASQPAVNGARSDSRTFGWGPQGGFVFQKAFVEFFISPGDWRRLEMGLRGSKAMISFYASNKNGDYVSSMLANNSAMNAVTWGVFPGKEYAYSHNSVSAKRLKFIESSHQRS